MASLTPRKGPSTPHITKQDMEASRLVFVFVKDAKPKRKVAIPVPDGYLWSEFLHQVKAKLRISGVKEILLASSGQRVTSLDELQDIDELCVVEGAEEMNGMTGNTALLRTGTASTSGQGMDSRQQSIGGDRFKVVVADGAGSGASRRGGPDDEGKYTRRASKLRRLLQRFLPTFFSPTLPVVNRDLSSLPSHDTDRGTEIARIKKRKPRRGVFSWQNMLPAVMIMLCMCVMLFLFLRAAPNLP